MKTAFHKCFCLSGRRKKLCPMAVFKRKTMPVVNFLSNVVVKVDPATKIQLDEG